MIAGRKVAIPKLTRHKSGAARVRIKGKDYWCGRFGTPESVERWRQLTAEYHRTGEAPQPAIVAAADAISVAEVVLRFWNEHVEVSYRKNGRATSERALFEAALSTLTGLYGSLPIAEFSPSRLREVRDLMARPKEKGGKGWSRQTVNKHVGRIRQMVRWGVEYELVSPSLLLSLQAVKGLKKGRTEARENRKVKPVLEADFEATLPHLPPVLRDMVRFQLLTGCRPGEACAIRPGDVTRGEKAWVYVPGSHKTEHHEHSRTIAIGPQAQAILTPYLARRADAYCFSPREAYAERLAEKSARRRTPLSCGNRPGSNRVAKPAKAPGERWDKDSYGRAVRRACKAAGVDPWSPNRLRHSAATLIRSRFGLDKAQAVLGHKNMKTTEIYAENEFTKAVEVACEIG